MANLTQAGFIRMYNDTHREQFNPVYFERNNQDIMDCVKKVILSCERERYFTLKVLSMREIYNYEEIYNMLHTYTSTRARKNSKAENPYDYIEIKDSDIMLLEVRYFIRHNGTEKQEVPKADGSQGKESIDVKDPYTELQVLIALPRFMNNYYFRLNGNYYTSTFQIVDGSTYNNANTNGGSNKKADCNTFKTLFSPCRIYKRYKDLIDVNTKNTIRLITYGSNIFNIYVDCMYYILANYGFYGTNDFLDIHCVYIQDHPVASDDWYSFERHGIYITVPKACIQDPMIQSYVVSIYNAIGKDCKINELFNIRFWIRNLGTAYKGSNPLDKGLFVLDSVDGIYDIITREELHLPDNMKANIYQILRWLMREFNNIKNKDNVDVTLKRVRIAEYVAAVYANKIAKGIHRISDAGKRITLYGVVKAVRTDPMYVINQIINMSNLVSYVDMVNDLDSMTAIKYTYKGISGLGEDGTSIQRNYRYVDPSHAGILDLDASSASDPGMSGMICPMAPMYNSSFTQYQEPNTWTEKYKPYQTDWFKNICSDPKIPFTFNPKFVPDEPEYTKLRQKVIDESLEIDKINCPIYNVYDRSIDYSGRAERLKQQEASSPQQSSLFNFEFSNFEEEDNNEDQ